MTFLIKQIFKLIYMIHSETGTWQVAAGIAAGFVLGMAPALSLQTLLIFACILIFRIQFGAAMLAAFFFKIIAYVFDPLFHDVGAWVLELPALRPAFTWLYNAPLVPYTRFNNSVVMGSGVVAFLFFPVVLILSSFLIRRYRETVFERFKQTKFFKAIKASSYYSWLENYRNIRAKVVL